MRFFDVHAHWRPRGDAQPVFPGLPGWRAVCAGTAPGDWAGIRRAVAVNPGVSAAYGLHPWMVDASLNLEDVLEELADRLREDPAALVGEIGLDYAVRGADRERQRAVFAGQLRLARDADRGGVVHGVRAWGALIETLDAVGPLPRGWILHAYSGSAETVAPLTARGAWFSVGGRLLKTRSARQVAAIRAIPPDRLLLESDLDLGSVSPDAYRQALEQAVTQLAALRAEPVDAMASHTWENAWRCLYPGAPHSTCF